MGSWIILKNNAHQGGNGNIITMLWDLLFAILNASDYYVALLDYPARLLYLHQKGYSGQLV